MTVIINIGIYCSVVLAFEEAQILTFLVVSTATAVIGSFVIGWMARIWSLKLLVSLIVIGWIVTLVSFVFIDHPVVIWVLGSVVGILLGGLWTTTRPLLAELVPREELGRFFGIFSLSGRAAAMIGPLVWTGVFFLFQSDRALGATVSDLLSLDDKGQETLPYKAGILSLAVMMAIGLFLFRKVPHGRRPVDE